MRPFILDAIDAERSHQELLKARGKFRFTCADPAISDESCLRVLIEEVGEVAVAVRRRAVARELNEADSGDRSVNVAHLRGELIQVAAIAVAWLEKLGQHPN
jgi:hypothetical protein